MFDSVLIISFGGPQGRADIRPFLANVLRGRRVSPERVEEVAHHYELFDGVSPIPELTRRQAEGLRQRLSASGRPLPVYVGMRNWHPFLADTVRQMQADGIRNAVGLIMALQQSDSSWEQYQRNVAEAVAQTGLSVDYAPPLFDHPKFIAAAALRVNECLSQVPTSDRARVPVVFTAHSIPTSDPFATRYVVQLNASASLVAGSLNHPAWQLAYQSRSGRPQDPWLEPDINDALRQVAESGEKFAVIVPIGFVCDHVEVLYDLDIEAARTADTLGLTVFRAKAVNADEGFIEALTDVVTGMVHA